MMWGEVDYNEDVAAEVRAAAVAAGIDAGALSHLDCFFESVALLTCSTEGLCPSFPKALWECKTR